MHNKERDLGVELGEIQSAIDAARKPRNSWQYVATTLRHLPDGEKLFIVECLPDMDSMVHLAGGCGPASTMLWDLLCRVPNVAPNATARIAWAYPDGDFFQSHPLYEWRDEQGWVPVPHGDEEINGLVFSYTSGTFHPRGWPDNED